MEDLSVLLDDLFDTTSTLSISSASLMDFLRHQTVTYDDAKNSKEMFLLFLKGKGNLLLRDLLLGGKPTGRKSGGECLQQFYDIW